MKKVCMVVPSFTAKGGIVSVVNGYKNSELEQKYHVKYIETYCDGNKLCKACKSILSYMNFIYLLLFWRPDLVHVHSSFGASFFRKLPFIFLSSFLNIKIINHIHGSDIDSLYTNASKEKQKLVIKTFKKCDKVIVLSEEWIKRYNGIIDYSKIEVVENYSILHEEAFEKRNNENKQILFLGFLSKDKGCFDIPSILKKVTETIPNITLVMAGSGEKRDIEKIKNEIKINEISSNVVLPGWIKGKEKRLLLENSDVFLLPSYREAMPMSILEAMGYGMAIVSTDVGGIPQLIKNGINGFMLKPGDITGIANALIEILSKDSNLKEMGNESLNIVKNKYSLEIHLRKIMNIYESVLSNK